MRIKQILYQKWPIHNSLFRTKLIFCSICMFSFKLSGRQKLFLKHKYQWIREYDNCSKRLDFDCWIFLLAHMVFSEMEECFVINCSPFSCCKLCIYCFYFLAFLDLSTFGCVRLCEKHLQKIIANHWWLWQSFLIKK